MFESLNHVLAIAYFGLFALIAIVCAGGLLISRHPLSGAINLIGVMLSLAGIYALLDNPFMAVLQVLVYAGAIMMLVIFVVMVLNQAKDHRVPYFDWFSFLALSLPLLIGGLMVHTVKSAPLKFDAAAPRAGAEVISPVLFDMTSAGPGYYLLFELIGILLLVAVVAAVLLAKRSLDSQVEAVAADTAKEDTHGH